MKRVVRVLSSLAITISGLAVWPGDAAAICEFLDRTPTASDVAATPVVFVGTVVSTDGSIAQFSVDQIWRGPDLPGLTTVVAGSLEDAVHWTPGIRYLVFASTEPGGKLSTGICGFTRDYRSSLDALRPADARQRYGTVQALAVVVAAAVGVAFVVGRVRGRPPGGRRLIRVRSPRS
jgi:hypothetical protein